MWVYSLFRLEAGFQFGGRPSSPTWYGDVDKEKTLTSKLLEKFSNTYVCHITSPTNILPADAGKGWLTVHGVCL